MVKAAAVASLLLALFAGQSAAATRAGPLPGFSGGAYTTPTGETVQIYSSPEYAADPDFNQRWANFLGSLPHGSELSQLTVYFAPLDRVHQVCGIRALACYDGESETIFSTGDDVPDRATAQSILAHEYGHHIAQNRSNPPWDAVDWGTKRWATYMNVCERAKAGTLFPGDEGDHYQLNPGEAFAEDYRVLVEQQDGLPASPWLAVDGSLYPDGTALQLVQEDIADPWAGDTTATYTNGFRPGSGIARVYSLAMPYDGVFAVTLRGPAGSSYDLRLFDTSGRLLASAVSTRRVKTLRYSVCGQRTLQLRVRRSKGFGPYTLAVSKP
jgi:hypothetical protein